MKILLALGSDPHDAVIATGLRSRDWTVVTDPKGFDAVQLVEAGGFDAVLLSTDLPDARRLIERLRLAERDLAVMAIGAAPTLAVKARLFEAGADDVITHPVAPEEIALRARAIARRRHGHRDSAIRFGDLVVVPGQHATVNGLRVPLPHSQFVVLEALALRAGRAVSRGDLMSRLYGGLDEPDPKIIDVFVCKMRTALCARGVSAKMIGTVWGLGWILPEPFAADAPMPSHGAECMRLLPKRPDPRRFTAAARRAGVGHGAAA